MNSEQNEFRAAFKGSFSGILRWPQLDALWQRLRADSAGDWYLYAVGETPPVAPVSGSDMARFIEEIDLLLRKEHDEEYCGIVYTDSKDDPGYIKIFDPNNLGVSCGFSEKPPLPGWILSRIPPIELEEALYPPNNRRRWWQRLFD